MLGCVGSLLRVPFASLSSFSSLSSALSKGKLSLVTSEHMSADKRTVIQRAVMEHVGVLGVSIVSRTLPPFHDVIEIEFEQAAHAASGPGGAKPVVWQGEPRTASPEPASGSSSGSASPPLSAYSASSSSSSSSSSAAHHSAPAADTLGRFSIRALVASLRDYSVPIVLVRTDGDLEARKAEIRAKREEELTAWRRAFLQSLCFTVPIAIVCWVLPLTSFNDTLMSSVHNALTIKAALLWLLVTPVQFGFGARFYRNAYKSLKHRSANMDVLIALGSSAAYFYSLLICLMCLSNERYEGNVFFETSALLISIVLLGRYVEHMAKGRTSEALSVLMGLQASVATLLQLDPATGAVISEEVIDVNLVQRDDLLLVHRGGKIPVDGLIVSEGGTFVDESLISGEAMPVAKSQGSVVVGGTINLESPIRVKATGVGSDTVLFKIVELVNDAQNSKAPIQAYADYVATIFVPVVVAIAVLTFVIWYALCAGGHVPEHWMKEHESSFLFSFLFAISVLLISCPCSLGLATPTAVMVGSGVGASLGVLFKGGEPLEITGKTDVVVVDKTGTLTEGKPSVSAAETAIYGLAALQLTETSMWTLVGSLAHLSEHLMSRAIACFAKDHHSMASPLAVLHFEALSGGGCGGTVQGRRVLVGNTRWLSSNGVDLTVEQQARMESMQTKGNIAVLAAVDGVLVAIISLSDAIKPEAEGTVRALHARGIEVFMLTGDNAVSALSVGALVGIPADHVVSQVTPAEKAEVVRRIQALGKKRGARKTEGAAAGMEEYSQSGLTAAMLHGPNAVPLPSASSGAEASPESIALRSGSDADADDGFERPVLPRSSSSPVVAFVGDGINDSVALAQADVGIAIGSGTDIAVETAQVVLMKSDLGDVVTAIDLSQATLQRIRRNFTWACIYNVLSIPIAAGCLYPIIHVSCALCFAFDSRAALTVGDLAASFAHSLILLCLSLCVVLLLQVGLPPILAAACMGLSSTSVIVSSLWLKRYRKPVLVHGEDSSGPTHARPQALAKLMGAVGGARRGGIGGGRSSRRNEGYDPMAQNQQDSEDDFTALPVDSDSAAADDVRTPDMNEHLGIEVPSSALMIKASAVAASSKRPPLQSLGPTRMPPRVKMLPSVAPRRVPLGSPLLPGPMSPSDALSDGDDGTPRASNYAAPSMHIEPSI